VHVGTDDTYIALAQSTVEPETTLAALCRCAGVTTSLTWWDDVEALRERLKSAGLSRLHARDSHPYRRRIYFFDRDGNDWEFVST